METLLHPLHPEFEDYLRDESRLAGEADSISFPRSEEEVREVLRGTAGGPVTVQGGRTGITGGAVPQGGHVLNLSRMDRLLELRLEEARGCWLARVQPGLPLSALNAALSGGEAGSLGGPGLPAGFPAGTWFFPPDPTETTATLGGMAATNASGARSFAYGPMRAHVEALRVLLADGSALAMRRGREKASGRNFSLTADSGRTFAGELPGYRLPEVKNAAGLYVRPDMDLLDLFIGCEGTLGVITELELRLSPRPPSIWAYLAFFPEEEDALRYVAALRGRPAGAGGGAERPAAIEYFDRRALQLLAEELSSFMPKLPQAEACLYVEHHAEREPGEEDLLAVIGALEGCGSGEELACSADTPRELERLKDIRHALPEKVNRLIAERQKSLPGITKLGTDLAVPAGLLERCLAMYRGDLAGLEHVKFGHIGDSHVHVNILPRSEQEYARGKELYARWAGEVIAWGGTISAEHGVGKFKVELLRRMYGSDSIDEMRRLIDLFNPGRRLNRGNMLI